MQVLINVQVLINEQGGFTFGERNCVQLSREHTVASPRIHTMKISQIRLYEDDKIVEESLSTDSTTVPGECWIFFRLLCSRASRVA